MIINATIEVDAVPVRMWLNELAGVGSRQVAERDRIVSRLYDGVLDRAINLEIGRPYWITEDRTGNRTVTFPAFQNGQIVRLHRRDGEFYPGIILERLGVYEGGLPSFFTGGEGWFVGKRTNAYRTEDLEIYEPISLAASSLETVVLIGKHVIAGGYEALYCSEDGMEWEPVTLTGYGEVNDLVYDGRNILSASENGLIEIRWPDKNQTVLAEGHYVGLSARFDNAYPYRIKKNGSNYEWYSPLGSLFRIFNQVSQYRHNVVEYDRLNAGFITCASNGDVWEVRKDTEKKLGTIASGSRQVIEPRTYPMRDISVIVCFGQLYWSDGQGLHHVYDFGEDVRSWPSLLGPVIIGRSGITYRLRRISYGL